MSEIKIIEINIDSEQEKLKILNAGDEVLLSGTAYTARDAAHARILNALKTSVEPPFPLEGAVIFYAGPAPKKPGAMSTAIGPTTSYRMDSFTPALLEAGVVATIGKGKRGCDVRAACKKHGAVYLIAVGGIAALLSKRVEKIDVFAYPDLGTEAIHKIVFDRFPCITAIDSMGNDIYED